MNKDIFVGDFQRAFSSAKLRATTAIGASALLAAAGISACNDKETRVVENDQSVTPITLTLEEMGADAGVTLNSEYQGTIIPKPPRCGCGGPPIESTITPDSVLY